MTFAERLRFYMDRADLKQAELSRLTGINKSALSEYLSGAYEPKQKNIYKLAVALNIKPSQLMGLAPPPEPINITPDEQELLDYYRSMNDTNKIKLRGMAQLLTSL